MYVRNGAKNGLICCLAMLLCLISVMVPGKAGLASSPAIAIVNAGFEQQAPGGVIPGWRQTYGNGVAAATYGITSTSKYSGSFSLHLDDLSPTAALGVESDKFAIVPGTAYSASAMFQVERGALSIYLQFFNEAGTRVANTSAGVDLSAGEWVKGGVSGIAPADAVTASVLLYSSTTGQGAGHIDDVKVEVNPIGTFESLGQPIMNFINQDAAIGREQGKDVAYTVVKGANDSTVFAVVDLLSADVIKTIPMPGVTGAWGVKAASDGKIYAGTHYDGHLYQYTPGSDSIVDLGRLGAETHIWALVAGADGKIYAGTYPNAHVFEYDPATNQVNDLGRVHPTEKYVRSIAYDGDNNVVYAGVGGVTAGIVKIDLATGTHEEILQTLLPAAYTNYDFATNMGYALGKLFVRLNKPDHLLIVDVATETVEYYDPNGLGMGSRTLAVMPGDDQNIYFGGYVLRSYNVVTKTFAVEFADPNARAFNFFDGKFLQLNDPQWPGYTFVGFSEKGQIFFNNKQTGNLSTLKVDNYGSPILIQSLHTGYDGNIYIGGYLGATGFTSYRPADGTFTDVQQFGQVESVASVNNKLYIGTYGNARVHEYDPTAPWTSANPRRVAELVSHGQDRPFAMVGVDSLSKLYVGSVPDYGSLSGALTVYDVPTRQVQVHKDIVHDQGVVSLAHRDGLIYGGTTIYGGLGTSGPSETEGKLFVFDTATNSKVFEIVPVPGRKVVSGLLDGPDGLIWGVAEDTIFKFDPDTQQIVYKAARLGRYGTGTVWVDAFLEVGKDGNVYGTNRQKTLFMIKPDTMEFFRIKTGAGNYLTQDHLGNLYMANDANLWKYTLPQEEEEVSLDSMRAAVDSYQAAGGMNSTFAAELKYRLNIIGILLGQGAAGQAAAYMQDFVSHIQDPAVLQQGLISAAASERLSADAAVLIQAWTA
ncbi:PQQ-like beta-propeller repeat protein [Paenibacillus oceani]|uniref:PQQ-like beta-propeller repeat protein n=1 Tax=Paenibacillus oceani TaxID=2772510 RepID=A0A927GZ23_9BACL|nr:PQQ-like beta-propeller repeat protein [Paenibacillus oceani]MBD2862531.1 PQQ-like beta-propeller repeat protein [Paenibacillus oceani]